MSRYRTLPVDLLSNPTFFQRSGDVQAILLGLVLLADDEGSGPADSQTLAGLLHKPVALLDEALAVLTACDFVQMDLRHGQPCYQLCQWHQWQASCRAPAPCQATGAPVSIVSPHDAFKEDKS